MENALKCPFCETELEQMHDKKMFGCSKCLHIADGAFWAKVIQEKQDLEIAREALKNISLCNLSSLPDYETIVNAMCNYAKNALKQIEHKA